MNKNTLAVLITLTWTVTGIAQTDSSHAYASAFYFTPANILRYGDFLLQNGDYVRAAAEYQRYLFADDGVHRPRAYYQLGVCQLRMAKPEPALGSFQKTAQLSTDKALRDSASVACLGALLLSHDNQTFLHEADSLRASDLSLPVQPKLLALQSIFFLHQQEWDRASATLGTTSSTVADMQDPLQPLRRLAARGKTLPKKSSFLAGMLSAIVPGSGKVYAGKGFDGFYSLLLVAGTGALAREGFVDHGASSMKGWLFGSVAAFFYLGNIYGSISAASLYNEDMQTRLAQDMDHQLHFWIHF